MRVLKKGNSNMKSLAYMSLKHPLLEYQALCRTHTTKVRYTC